METAGLKRNSFGEAVLFEEITDMFVVFWDFNFETLIV